MLKNKKISFSQLKTFQNYLDGNECLLSYHKKYYLGEWGESGEAAAMGKHYEYLITEQEPTRGSEYEKVLTINGKKTEKGDYYKNWSHLPEIANNFIEFCKFHKIEWKGGQTHELILDGIRHKIVTDIEAIYNGENLIIDLKCTGSLSRNIRKDWSWKVDNWTDTVQMLHNGYKIWQAKYYCAFMLQKMGENRPFLFFVQSGSEADKSYFPYFLRFSDVELVEFWEQMLSLIKTEVEIMSFFDKKSFVGEYKNCINCNSFDTCDNKCTANNIINVDLSE